MLTKTPLSTELAKLKSFLLQKAPTCVHKPEGLLKFKYVTPTYEVIPGGDDNAVVPERSLVGHYLQMYDWDSCLFSQAQAFFDMDGLATEIVSNFLSLKQSDGFIPRTISPRRTWDGNDLCKPFLSQALLHEVKARKGSGQIAHQLLEDLKCYLDYFIRTRRNQSGLYHWRNVLESGVDDNLALLSPMEASKDENDPIAVYPDGRILAVDLNSYLVMEFRAFSALTRLSGRPDLGKPYEKEANDLVRLIEEMLWSEHLGMYCNLDPSTSKQVAVRTWTGLLPSLFGFAKPERIEQTIETCIMDQAHFLRPFGLASVAASELLYNQAKRGLYGRAIVSNWQGPVWVLPNAIAVRGLLALGHKGEAEEIARRCLSALVNGLRDFGTLFENYNAETGEPLWAPKFMSWNALAMELIQVIE
jgi:glycogen debranching enzyme